VLLELGLGVLAGGIHTVSGADHLAAMAPLALRRPREGARIGLQWGLGHGCGVAALGGVGWWLRGRVALEAWSETAEAGVGVVLILVGLWAVRSALRARLHAHPHRHDLEHGTSGEREHSHVHLHRHQDGHAVGGESADSREAILAHGHHHTALAVGALHGVAGTAHLVGVLPGLMMPSVPALLGYLLGYGAGATLAMCGFGWLTGRVARARGFDATRAYRLLLSSAGVAAIAVGGLWIAG